MVKKTDLYEMAAKELKDKGLDSEYDIFNYLRGKGYVDLNVLDHMKEIKRRLK